MATSEQIDSLRRLVAEPTQDNYTHLMLSDIIDATGSLNAAALQVWTEKAAGYVALVDISEGGSQRKNSDLLDHALKMIEIYTGLVGGEGRTKIARLTRT